MKRILYIITFTLLTLSASAQVTAAQRATAIEKGMCLSWLERYWLVDSAQGNVSYFDFAKMPSRKNDIKTMKSMGVKTLRLPVWFHGWYNSNINPSPKVGNNYFGVIDSFIKWTDEQGMNLIIDFHHGILSKRNLNTEGVRIANIWQKVATRFKYTNPNKVFFELYNEPNDVTTFEWMGVAKTITDSIRKVTKTHTLIIGPSQFNDISEIDAMVPLNDNNIIYTFHFYDPFLFTHQGASWVNDGVPVATTGIPFPYNSATMPPLNPIAKNTFGEDLYNAYSTGGTVAQIKTALNNAKQWQTRYNRPVICGEMGSSATYAADDSRCRHLKSIRQELETLGFSFCWWDFDGEFRLFKSDIPNINSISECMREAWGMPSTAQPIDTISSNQDLSLSISASNLTPSPFSTETVTITLKNNSKAAFTNIIIECKLPEGIVNGGSTTPSVGSWREFCSSGIKCYNWSINQLNAYATATLTVPIFVLNNHSQFILTPTLISSAPQDLKTSNNKANITLTLASNANSTQLTLNKPSQQIPIVVQAIYPNPTDAEISIIVESIVEKELEFNISNNIGENILTKTHPIKVGKNELYFNVSELPEGMYFILPQSNLGRNRPVKFVKM